MYDPKFEKAIQQKMAELEFCPPESVWVNIEKAVVVKRRRRMGLIWRYLLPGVFVVAAAGLYWHYTGGKAGSQPAGPTHTDYTSGAGRTGTAGRSVGQMGQTSQAGRSSVGSRGTVISRSPVIDHTAIPNQTAITGQPSTTRQTAITHRTSTDGQTANAGQAGTPGRAGIDVQTANAPVEATSLAGTDAQTANGVAGTTRLAGTTGVGGGSQAAGQKGLSAWFYRPGLVDQRLTPQVQGSMLNVKKSNSVATAGLSHPQRHWEAGFVAGGGLSRLNRLNSDQAKVALSSNATSFYAIANTSSSSHYISNVQPEASFEGGIYLQRALSDRWILNTGMNLHYYSNRITVGQQVTTYVQPSISYLVSSTAPAALNQAMYSAGDTRSLINKYYFLELPVGLQWQVNKSHLLPIFVEGGVSLSRLMGANALLYNAKTGLYSKDGDIVNKTQFNIESALLVGLPFHGVNIELGPQIQYGLTPLVNTQGVGDQHFLYTGIRLVIIPGKK